MVPHVLIILAVLVAAYAAAKASGLSVELSIFVSAVAGAITGAIFATPAAAEIPRHLVEGSFTYLDVILVFFTATLFMDIVHASGGVDYVVGGILRGLRRVRVLALLALMVIILVPGALTGAGSVSLLVVGAPVAMALRGLGVSPRRAAAILFVIAGLSAAAPPVNIWAMILCAGTAIPYVGFEFTLGLPVLALGTFTVLTLGLKKDGSTAETAALPDPPAGMAWWRVAVPFLLFFGMVVAYRLWPFTTPILGLALEFAICAAAAVLLSPRRLAVLEIARTTVKRLLPLLATMVVIGMLQQVLTATGVRGLVSYLVISMPLVLLFVLLPLIIPASEAVLTYGGAAVIGIPLVWSLDSIGYHATVVIAALSLLWPLGDGLPPTRLIGRLSLMVSDYRDSYGSFLRTTWLPWLVITAAAVLMMIFSTKLAFLVRWSA